MQSFWSCVAGLPTWAEMVGLDPSKVTDADKESPRQNHMLGCLRGFNAANLFLCAMAWATPADSFFRSQLLASEGIMYALCGLDAYMLGVTKFLPAYLGPAFLSGFAVARDYFNRRT